MAVLSAAELQAARRRAAGFYNPSWTKAQVNAALQAIEDEMVSNSNVGAKSHKVAIGQAVEAAAAGAFTAGQKDTLFIIWTMLNAARGGVI